MEQYKLINAQLMEQVQSQRKIIGQMREEEVKLKRKWMEEHERRLAEVQYHENKLKCAIRTLLHSLDMNLNFEVSSSSENTRISRTTETARSSRSNSNTICSEFRRSSILLQSSVPTSPNRRQSSQSSRRSIDVEQIESLPEAAIDVGPTILTTPQPRRLNELQQYSSSPETEDVAEEQTLKSPVGMSSVLVYSTIVESDSEDASFSSTVEYIEAEARKKPSPMPLRDVTNSSSRLNSSPKNTKPRSNPAFINRIETENDFQETATVHVRRAPQQRRQALLPTSPKKNETDCDILVESIEHIRHATRASSPVLLSVPAASVNVIPDLTPRRSQLNFDRFNGIIDRPGDCSTPQNSVKATVSRVVSKSTKAQRNTADSCRESSGQLSSESILSGRPSRRCRPKSLKEPTLNSKMRNESGSNI